MFELSTERARRTIFFARYEASHLSNPYIETEHLLLGVLREDKGLANSLLGSHAEIESIRKQIETQNKTRESISSSVDTPLSDECKRVLVYGVEEASWLKQHIDTPHLVLGLLREENSFAAQILRERGLTLNSVREELGRSRNPSATQESALVAGLDQWLAEREAHGGLRIVKQERAAKSLHHFAIYIGDPLREDEKGKDGISLRVPLLCIEIIHDDRFSDVQKRCDDYIAEGVAEVWLLDANCKRVYTVTQTEGLREFRGEILRIAEPLLEMDVKKIFN